MPPKPKIPTTSRNLAVIALVSTLAFVSGIVAAKSSTALGAKEARDLIKNLSGLPSESDQVRIKSINSGLGDSAIVEAELRTAFRFVRKEKEWSVADVRISDRQWESIELLQTAITKEKVERTQKIMGELSGALEAYYKERSRFPVCDTIEPVFDALIPTYSAHPPQLDLWGMPFAYRGTENSYRLSSSGPDRKINTADDLVVAGGMRSGK